MCLSYSELACLSIPGLLIFRTYAFWQQSKKVLIWLLILAAVRADSVIRRSELNLHSNRFASQVPSGWQKLWITWTLLPLEVLVLSIVRGAPFANLLQQIRQAACSKAGSLALYSTLSWYYLSWVVHIDAITYPSRWPEMLQRSWSLPFTRGSTSTRILTVASLRPYTAMGWCTWLVS
jgi:hypothetical protein